MLNCPPVTSLTNFFRISWLSLGLTLTAIGASDYPVSVTIFQFGGRWDLARFTQLAVVNAGADQRLHTTNMVFAGKYEVPNPEQLPSIIADLQRAALDRMLDEGYMTRELYDELLSGHGVWDPHQVRYALAWSELTVKEAREIFDNKIPWERVLNNPHGKNLPDGNKIKIVRSSVMLAVGQRIDSFTGELLPIPLPWQTYAPYAEVSNLDRSKFLLVAEISRILNSEGPLPLNAVLPARALVAMLEEEAAILGIASHRYLVFGRTLSADRAGYFRTLFKMASFDPALKQFFEGEPDRAAEMVPRIALPEPVPPQLLMVGTVDKIAEILATPRLSQRRENLRRISANRLTLADVRKLQTIFDRQVCRHFVLPDDADRFPLSVMDGTLLPHASAAEFLEAKGLGHVLDPMLAEMIQIFTDVDPTSDFWIERGVVRENRQLPDTVAIRNLSETAATASPVTYVTRALLSVRTHYRNQIVYSSLSRKRQLALIATRYRRGELLGQSFTADDFLRRITFLVITSSHVVANQLRTLGGKEEEAILIGEPNIEVLAKTGKIQFGGKAYAFRFDDKTLAQLEGWSQNTVLNLQPDCAEHLMRATLIRMAPHF